MAGSTRDELGRHGEDVAAQYLAERGMVVLSRNWRCREATALHQDSWSGLWTTNGLGTTACSSHHDRSALAVLDNFPGALGRPLHLLSAEQRDKGDHLVLP